MTFKFWASSGLVEKMGPGLFGLNAYVLRALHWARAYELGPKPILSLVSSLWANIMKRASDWKLKKVAFVGFETFFVVSCFLFVRLDRQRRLPMQHKTILAVSLPILIPIPIPCNTTLAKNNECEQLLSSQYWLQQLLLQIFDPPRSHAF